jgi:hypothetical protein
MTAFGARPGIFPLEYGQHGFLELISLNPEEFDIFCACADGMRLWRRAIAAERGAGSQVQMGCEPERAGS